jgi:hypothetical protein
MGARPKRGKNSEYQTRISTIIKPRTGEIVKATQVQNFLSGMSSDAITRM